MKAETRLLRVKPEGLFGIERGQNRESSLKRLSQVKNLYIDVKFFNRGNFADIQNIHNQR